MVKMPEVYLKPLKYKSLEELNKRLTGFERLLQDKTAEQMLKTAMQLPSFGDKAVKEGDEEEAFILFMRFIHLGVAAKKLPEPKRSQLKPIYTGKLIVHCLEQAEVLNKSLERRYKSSEEDRNLQNAAFKMVQMPKELPPVKPHNGFSGVNDAKKLREYVNDEISCKELFELINQCRGTTKLIIMDVRSGKDFRESHIDFPCVISVPEHLIKAGITALKVENDLPSESKHLYRCRKEADYIVLVDWWSKTVAPLSTLYHMRNIIMKWDVAVNYKRNPIFLLGGYTEWLECYPPHTTNPRVPLKYSPDSLVDPFMLDEIEYPDFSTQMMEPQPNVNRELKPMPPKIAFVQPPLNPVSTPMPVSKPAVADTNNFTGPVIPVIDRSSKQQAIEKMEKEREEILGKTLKTQNELFEAERKWDQLRREREEEASKEAQELKEEQYLNEIQRLEKHCKQLDIENAKLKNKIQEVSGEAINDDKVNNDIDKIKALTNQMAKVRISSHQRPRPVAPPIDKPPINIERTNKPLTRREPLKREPSEPSNLARSHSSPNIKDLDDNTPQFDRNSKPLAKTNNDAFMFRMPTRDLSPVYGTKGRGLTGLKNLGNSCYMNSIVQCISNTLELTEYFCKGTYRNDVNMNTKAKGQIVEELAVVVRALWAGEYRTVACRDFKRVAGNCHRDFGGVRQQDSHEFLTLLMDWLHDGLNKRINLKQRITAPAPEEPPLQNVEESSEKMWFEFERYNESRILHLFYGQLSSTVTCNTCGFNSVTFEPFSTLSLVLPQNSEKCSLKDCLDFYLAAEPIQEWRCPACKQNRRATKKFDIWRLPPILVIHFKRFCEDIAWRKQHTLVEFPLHRLQMSPYTKRPNQKHNTYNLYAVSNHYGTMEGGHYTTYSHSREFKKWYKFDDADVSEISESSVRSNAAYILFYASANLATSSFIIPQDR